MIWWWAWRTTRSRRWSSSTGLLASALSLRVAQNTCNSKLNMHGNIFSLPLFLKKKKIIFRLSWFLIEINVPLLFRFTLLQCKALCTGKFRSSAKLTTDMLRPLCTLVATLSRLSREHHVLYVRTSCSSSLFFCSYAWKASHHRPDFGFGWCKGGTGGRGWSLKSTVKNSGLSCKTFKKLCMIMDRAMQPQDRGDVSQNCCKALVFICLRVRKMLLKPQKNPKILVA